MAEVGPKGSMRSGAWARGSTGQPRCSPRRRWRSSPTCSAGSARAATSCSPPGPPAGPRSPPRAGSTSCPETAHVRDGGLAGAAGPRRPGRPPGGDHRPDRAARWRSTRSTPARRSGWPTSRTPTPRTGRNVVGGQVNLLRRRPAARSRSPPRTARSTRCATTAPLPTIVLAPARLAPGRAAPAGRRRAGGRRAGRLRALLLPQRRRAARAAAAGRTSTCRRWRATSRRGCGTTSSTYAAGGARHPARHDPRHGADRDHPGRVRDGGDPLRAARRTPPGSTPAAGTTCSASSRTSATPGREFVLPDRGRGDDDRAVHAGVHRAAGRRPATAAARSRSAGWPRSSPAGATPRSTSGRWPRSATDKEREAGDGFDGSWVAHPDLVPVCREVFDARARRPPEPARPAARRRARRRRRSCSTSRPTPAARSPRPGCAATSRSALRYLAAWLRGNGAVGIHNLMEDAATAEISRSQVWQWMHKPASCSTRRAR